MNSAAHMCRVHQPTYKGDMYTSKIRPAIEKYLNDRPSEATFLRSHTGEQHI